MKKVYALASLLLAAGSPALAQGTELFFSEYDEGAQQTGVVCAGAATASTGGEKAIEIYNPTTSTVSLNAYSLRRYSNGSLVVTEDERLMRTTGANTLAPGATFVIIHPDATIPAILAAKNQTSSIRASGPNATVLVGGGPIQYNGDDAMALVRWSSGVAGQGTPYLVDIFGIIGNQPAAPSQWDATSTNGVFTASANQSLVRQATVSGGSTTWDMNTNPALDVFAFNISTEWETYSTAFPNGVADPCSQSYTDLGTHSYIGPHGTYQASVGAPSITSFAPASGVVGASVTLTGTSFTGATSVKFNGTAATFTVVSATSITTTVPVGATTGAVSVTSANGTGTSTAS